MMSTKKGFTLAEVLTTLMVIGIVAAMSIPALIGSTQKQELRVGFKKAVAALNQAAAMQMAAENEQSNFATTKDLANYLSEKLNTMGGVDGNAGFYTADGIYYKVLVAGDGGCPTSGAGMTSSTKCLIAVDVNGDKGKKVADIKTAPADNNLSDQFYVVFTGTNVVPAKAAGYLVAENVMIGRTVDK